MAIIASDIHGDPAAARAFLEYQPDELHVCLGDLVDSRDKNITEANEKRCLDLLLQSDSILLWGNHDLAYLREEPWRAFCDFQGRVWPEFQFARSRFLAAYAVDGWLCTHAGVSPGLARKIPSEVLAAGVDAVATWLNDEFLRELAIKNPHAAIPRYGYGPLFNIPVCRGGTDHFGGIFWFDADGEQSQPSHLLPQIFGHTPNDRPKKGVSVDLAGIEMSAPWVSLKTREGLWVYDTQRDELVQVA